ncbi:MAG: hypothetical protein ACTHMQ_09455 [Protaetiibacter sp.]
MELGSVTRSWILDNREAELALAAERARRAHERRALERLAAARDDAAGGNLLSRLRRRRAIAVRPVMR